MTGTIIKGIGGFYYIKTEDEIIECKARGKFRHNELKPMVGDKVEIEVTDGKGVINSIHERSSELIRPTVANVTQAYVVFAIKNPDINFDLLNKFLVLCEHNNIKAIVCLNKVDLCSEEEINEIKTTINNIGYEVLLINAKGQAGLEDLKVKLSDNVTVLCGPSGAGKSTLINAFAETEHMETGEISEKLKRGKHTTRHSELIPIKHGFLVDTPGFSSLDLDFIEKDDLKYCLPEFLEYNEKCKFTGCSHYKEPNCAVKNAVEEGNISKLRYEFYVRALEDIMRRKIKW